MLWNKRKSAESSRLDTSTPEPSGSRVAGDDRALDGVVTLLDSYGRHAFDTDRNAAARIREQCASWIQRIALGEARRGSDGEPPSTAAPRRDWGGLARFFDDQRKEEGDYVTRTIGTLRQAVLSFARCVSGSTGEDLEADARVEEHLEALQRALEKSDTRAIADQATRVIRTARESMAQRRKREARHVTELSTQLKQLREELAVASDSAGVDATTGLFNRTAFDQHLDQLAAIGALLTGRPWLISLEVDNLESVTNRFGQPMSDDILRQVSNVLSRTFLRKQDFVARYAGERLSVLLVDITEEQVVAAVERLLTGVRKLAVRPTMSRALSITASIGLTQLRANDTAATWSARANLALERAKEDGRDRSEMSR